MGENQSIASNLGGGDDSNTRIVNLRNCQKIRASDMTDLPGSEFEDNIEFSIECSGNFEEKNSNKVAIQSTSAMISNDSDSMRYHPQVDPDELLRQLNEMKEEIAREFERTQRYQDVLPQRQ